MYRSSIIRRRIRGAAQRRISEVPWQRVVVPCAAVCSVHRAWLRAAPHGQRASLARAASDSGRLDSGRLACAFGAVRICAPHSGGAEEGGGAQALAEVALGLGGVGGTVGVDELAGVVERMCLDESTLCSSSDDESTERPCTYTSGEGQGWDQG